LAKETLVEPQSYKQAMSSPDREKWKEACDDEYDSLMENGTWELVLLPEGANLIGSRWVFKVKMDLNNLPERFKARLVAQGYTQIYGEDYEDTFAPVISMKSFRLILALSVRLKLIVYQCDIVTAFLYGFVKQDLYMKQPEGYVNPGKSNYVCKLKRSLYGLKQSPMEWYTVLTEFMVLSGFKRAAPDQAVFIKHSDEGTLLIGVYVDDMVVATDCNDLYDKFKKSIGSKFKLKDLGNIKHCIGMEIKQDLATYHISMNQNLYLQNVLQRFELGDCKPTPTPMEVGVNLTLAEHSDLSIPYRQAVGSLMWLMLCT